MRGYVLRSLLRALLIMLAVMSCVFVALRLGPLDPAQQILGDYATSETLKQLRGAMGLDQPIYAQYLSFIGQTVRGDLGRSFMNNQSVLSQLLGVLPYTVELVLAGVLIGLVAGIPLGIVSAIRAKRGADHLIRMTTLVGISLPAFVVGIFLITIFSLKLNLLPAIGGESAGGLREHLLQLVLPALSCGFMMVASVTRLIRDSLLEILKKDYVQVARAKGLPEYVVICKHAMRNSLLSLVTFVGIYVNILLGSAVVIEVIFNRPGVGRLIVEAIRSNDFPVVQIVIMFYAGTVVLVNVLIDIVYCVVDPRIAFS